MVQDVCQEGESVSIRWPVDGSKTQQMLQETARRSGAGEIETDGSLCSPRCTAEMPVGLIPVSVFKVKSDAHYLLSKENL